MVFEVVAVRDRAVDGYGRPLFVASVGQAIRSFSDEINREDPENVMKRHPDDYDLYRLASFDDATGLFRVAEMPELLAVGKNLVR